MTGAYLECPGAWLGSAAPRPSSQRLEWMQRCRPPGSRRRRRAPYWYYRGEQPDDRGKDGTLHFVVFATSNILVPSHHLFPIELYLQISEDGGSRRVRRLQWIEKMKRGVPMRPKPRTSQPQRATATAMASTNCSCLYLPMSLMSLVYNTL